MALFWLLMYKPLIENALPQLPVTRTGSHPDFITDRFTSLRGINPVELRVDASMARRVVDLIAVSEKSRKIIGLIPAKYLRWPAIDSLLSKFSRSAALLTLCR